MAQLIKVALAFVIMAVAVHSATQDCFLLQGITDEGLPLGFVQVGPSLWGTEAMFVSSSSQATQFGIDRNTGNLVDHTDNELTASYSSDGFFDNLYFETQQSMVLNDRLAVDCRLNCDDTMTCAAQNFPNNDVWNYCSDEGTVSLYSSARFDFGCQGLVLQATAAHGCPTTGTTTPTTYAQCSLPPSPTTSSIPAPTGPLCYGSEDRICKDDFLIRCERRIYAGTSGATFYYVNTASSRDECHQACENNADCTIWIYYEEEVDLYSCQNSEDMISPNLVFSVEPYYSAGIKGRCS